MVIVITNTMDVLPEGSYIKEGQVDPMNVRDFITRTGETTTVYEYNKVKPSMLSTDIKRYLKSSCRYFRLPSDELKEELRALEHSEILVFLVKGAEVYQYRKETRQYRLFD